MDSHLPTLETPRLILRPFVLEDAPRIMELAGDRLIYATTLNVPYPYQDGMAEKWIATHAPQFCEGKGVNLAIVLKDENAVIGSISLGAAPKHKRAELGYWVGVAYWNRGYCTEAAKAVIDFGFHALSYHKITARHLANNSASGRVMEKAGMKFEGELVDEIIKDGQYHSLKVYGVISGVK